MTLDDTDNASMLSHGHGPPNISFKRILPGGDEPKSLKKFPFMYERSP